MMQATLYLVRHAQSGNNAKPEHERVPDPGITDIGIEQSTYLAQAVEKLSPTLLYCSPFLRSLQTTEPVADRVKIQPKIRQDLYEQGGCYQGHLPGELRPVRGKGREEIANMFPRWELDPRIVDSGWNDNDCYESREKALARAKTARAWFEREQEAHQNQSVVMIIHADFILRMLEAFLDWDDIDRHLHDPANTSISCIKRIGGRWKMEYFNAFHHLPSKLVTY